MTKNADAFARLPSVDEVLRSREGAGATERFGRSATLDGVRRILDDARRAIQNGAAPPFDAGEIAARATQLLERQAAPTVRPVFNLTGTVIHTNLGRSLLAEAAIEAATRAMRETIALEFDLATGKRGERDALVRGLLCELTGAEDATIVNNNAAAVLLTLNTLAKGREVIVSRGELIEIGGAFRMPDIMARAGAKLREVGTTNRTHEKDYVEALCERTGLILKVHTSNYRVEGFVADVKAQTLAKLARHHDVPLVNDLGSGTLIDLAQFGLAHEPTVAEAVRECAALVTFSGDKLLGGPQAGFIVGRKDLIARINRNPLKRALRLDKIRLAAIEATLRLYRDPDRIAQKLPTIRLLARRKDEIEALARELLPALSRALGDAFEARIVALSSQIGSGALPLETLASVGLAISARGKSGAGRSVTSLASRLRALPVPVIGRIEKDSLILDLRCLEAAGPFIENISKLAP
jgi:L-seryl-tRNA(Ser) seleniumtransferase